MSDVREAVDLWLPAPEGDMLAYLGVAFSKPYRTPAAWRKWIRGCTRRPIEGWPAAMWLMDTRNERVAALVPVRLSDKPVLSFAPTGTMAVVPIETAVAMKARAIANQTAPDGARE